MDGEHAHLQGLVSDVRVTADAFGELFRLIEEKFQSDSLVDCLALVLCQRLEQLGEQLEDAITRRPSVEGVRGNAPARGQGAGDGPLGAGEGLGTLRAE